ncbi:uncharacterized protein LOC132195292 [Neocloeon triangulifer]|uniref:uncharacterized protein LOC132195292 n=1 Tax=Neocloeon triangulifer TaxID=2078957 RepID=UPI00286F9ECC|nr:uncharacterized protein LOC132195292 [Neocloeon triangulifer]
MTRVVLVGLLLCVPLQLWLAWDLRDPDRTLKEQLVHFKRLLVDGVDWWRRWYFRSLNSVRSLWRKTSRYNLYHEECPAKEVEMYRMSKGFFGQSPDVRPYRPDYLKLRIGQVVRVDNFENPGVIISWDLYARAPEDWLAEKYGKNLELRKEPHYRVLLGQPNSKEVYVPQRQINVLKATQVRHPKVSEIFHGFDGAQYIPKERLKKNFPLD